jgi:glycosyltransferase involved in cell wall biosynthesis
MGFAENYFLKHNFLTPQIKEPPMGLLSFIIIIPAYLEENLLDTLECLHQADRPEGAAEVIIVFNSAETDTEENKKINRQQYQLTREWSKQQSTSSLRFFPILIDNLPVKHAGAGLARKIGMDEALNRFNFTDNKEGMILSLDADTRVSSNYFTAIETSLQKHPEAGGCLIPFCHPIHGDEFTSEIYKAITQYELHLRYYKHMLQFIGFPYANYTIGSCFGVRAGVYARNGGMNRRKAGEDFYFLNKLFPHYTFVNVTDTIVFPSPRPSLRVPFGTGPVIHRLIQTSYSDYRTYNPQSFLELKRLFDAVPAIYTMKQSEIRLFFPTLPVAVQSFLMMQEFFIKIREFVENTSTSQAFIKRFYLWFDGFKVVKYLNFVHEVYFQKIPVKDAAGEFLKLNEFSVQKNDEAELLGIFRRLDQIV